MPPAAAEESHPPTTIPNDNEDVEDEESDSYEIEVGSSSYRYFPPLVNFALYREMMMMRTNTMKMRKMKRKMKKKQNQME